MSEEIDVGEYSKKGFRATGFAVARDRRRTAAHQLDSECPTLSANNGAPNHNAPNGSLYMREDGSAGSTLYMMIAGTWTAIAATAVSGTDFGSGGLATDVIAESTAATGVLIDGVLLKDERIDASGAGTATGDAGVTLKDNLASAFDVKESTNVYLRFCSTNSSEAVQLFQRTTTTDGVASGTARIVGGIALSDPVASTAITGTTETQTNFDHGSYTVPAATLKVGTVVRIRARGRYTATTGSETHVFGVAFGATSLCVTGNIDPADNQIFDIEFEFVCRATGASGTVVGSGRCISGTQATVTGVIHFLATGSAATSTTTVDTTQAAALAVYVDRQASATDGDSLRLDTFAVEILG